MFLTTTAINTWGIVLLFPIAGLFLQSLLFFTKRNEGPRIAALMLWSSFFLTVILWMLKIPFEDPISYGGFRPDLLSWVMITLVLFVSSNVHTFSLNYMAGSRFYRRYFIKLSAVTISALLMVSAENWALLSFFWLLSNMLLVLLMVHQPKWQQAKNSGILAAKTLGMGACFLWTGLYLTEYPIISALLLFLAAIAQSGVWPFHCWLISSLNSPTPVSALMHAGLVNGGGFLLARFANLYLDRPLLSLILFTAGAFTLIIGTLYKMVQSDAKRMLACSTMGQMGFMVMQCGLGLFPAAIAHLCWHGLYKACLFLGIGSAVQDKFEKSLQIDAIPRAAFCGLFGAFLFMRSSGKEFFEGNTELVLILFAWIAATHFSIHIVKKCGIIITAVISAFIGALYGGSVFFIESILAPLKIAQPQTLHPIHVIVMVSIVAGWLYLNLKPMAPKLYLNLLNGSQPYSKTVTVNRYDYEY